MITFLGSRSKIFLRAKRTSVKKRPPSCLVSVEPDFLLERVDLHRHHVARLHLRPERQACSFPTPRVHLQPPVDRHPSQQSREKG